MMYDYFFVSIFVASIAVLWRNLQVDLPRIGSFLDRYFPWVIRKALTCGSCFTYWFALASVIVFNPLKDWVLPLRFFINPSFYFFAHLFVSWMVVGLAAVALRFGYVVLQELVHYQTHVLREGHKH